MSMRFAASKPSSRARRSITFQHQLGSFQIAPDSRWSVGEHELARRRFECPYSARPGRSVNPHRYTILVDCDAVRLHRN